MTKAASKAREVVAKATSKADEVVAEPACKADEVEGTCQFTCALERQGVLVAFMCGPGVTVFCCGQTPHAVSCVPNSRCIAKRRP